MLQKSRLAPVIVVLMFSGATVAYLAIRFSDGRPFSDASTIVELAGALFSLFLLCAIAFVKCSADLRRAEDSADSLIDGLKDVERQHAALVSLAQSAAIGKGDIAAAAKEVTEMIGETMSADRVSAWLRNKDGTGINCLDLYQIKGKSHIVRKCILFEEFQEFFDWLNSSRIVRIDDTDNETRVDTMRERFINPLKIRSIINVPMRINGEVVGYIFVSAVRKPRFWKVHELDFVAAVGDQLAHCIANDNTLRKIGALNKVMLATSAATGQEFFDLLVCQLCSVLEVRYSMVSKWSQETEENMRSLALADSGVIAPPVEYSLASTPCAEVVENGFLEITENLAQLYPDDEIAQDLQVASYLGVPLLDSAGKKIGILNVFHTAKIPRPDTAKMLLEILAVRASMELERIDTLAELNANRALLSATLNSTADGLLVVDKAGAVMMTNKRFAELWQLPQALIDAGDDDKLLAYSLDKLVDPDSFVQKVRELYDSDRVDFDVVLFKDGRMLERYSCPLMLDGGCAGRVWSFRDITVKERAVASLQESEDRYHGIFNCTTDSLILFNPDGDVVEVNRTACELHGFSEDEFLRLPPEKFVHKDSLASFNEFIEKLATGESYQCVAQDLHKDGSIIDVEITGAPISIGGEPHFLCVERDITERKQRERKERQMKEKLERAERMQSIGALAGGVAHDLNNILGPLVAYPELLLMKLPEDSPFRERIELIGKSARHAADVIQDLLTLARRGRVELQPGNASDVVSEALRSSNFVDLERKHPAVEIVLDLASDLPLVDISKAHLSKAIFNLCANAFDSMSKESSGGTLKVTTRKVYLERLESGYEALKPGEYIEVKVCDTGPEISDERLAKLFEPYYNKENFANSASGLGLAIVYGIVKDHGGYYDVVSRPGVGNEYILYLPVVAQSAQTEFLKPSSFRGSETVLVVDDDDGQRTLACALLESLGYHVCSVPDGWSGIEALKSQPIDIVVLDMIIDDDMDGLDTYREMLKVNPQQKAVIVTGFAATERVDEAQRLGAGAYVKKPYTRDAIGKAVRETLDKSAKTAHV